jgi:hypothetical protein
MYRQCGSMNVVGLGSGPCARSHSERSAPVRLFSRESGSRPARWDERPRNLLQFNGNSHASRARGIADRMDATRQGATSRNQPKSLKINGSFIGYSTILAEPLWGEGSDD